MKQLRRAGLFDKNVPRYTSYPPANHFTSEGGRLHQRKWLSAVPAGSNVSLYVHIPFCKRLCWFCACRTQGTSTMRPVEAYVENVIDELRLVRAQMQGDIGLARLHLGGGTPTILPSSIMQRLLQEIFAVFRKADGFEFSVEVDPTEAADDLLVTLAEHGMNRASIGVQDFHPHVQESIGRLQSFEQTAHVVEVLRAADVRSLNIDLLYGLPHQSARSMADSLQKVLSLQPDRLALYGYAHVPWMSKRQVMIDAEALPGAEQRFALSELAHQILVADGFDAIGIDHFARPDDSLAIAHRQGALRRNFQGYTDDASDVLIGLGASSISSFQQGFVQNSTATSDYVRHILEGDLPGARGYVLSEKDKVQGRMIESLMCNFRLDASVLGQEFPAHRHTIRQSIELLHQQYPNHVSGSDSVLLIKPSSRALVRIIANTLDSFVSQSDRHSRAI